jgi:predicted N-acetyltransferase YhbS
MTVMPHRAVVRTATPEDRDAILALVLAAFSSDDHDGHEEVEIVTSTWEVGATSLGLELVAVMNRVIVGHVLAAWGDLGGRDVVAVAPLAVSPSHQGVGIGSALMIELLRQAEAAALPLLVLLGHPGFYGRFGLEAPGPLGIVYRAVGEGNPHLPVRRFESYDESYRGDFTYCWESNRDS